MKAFLSTFLLFLVCFLGSSFKKANPEKPFSLKVNIHNIRNQKGYLYIYIYDYHKQYPYHPYRHYKIDKSKVRNGKLTYYIRQLKKNNYAITLIDDENNNKDLDRFLGIPKEGFAFSNNIKTLLLPRYNSLLFEVNSVNQEINLKVRYL